MMPTKYISLMIPEYIDRCPSILKELSEEDRNVIVNILERAKKNRKNGKNPLGNYVSKIDMILISDAISKLPDIDTNDEDD